MIKNLIDKQSFRKAYESYSAKLGILLAAVSIFSLFYSIFAFSLSQIFELLVNAYQGVFHTVFDFLFIWVRVFAPDLIVPNWVKDLCVVYLLSGSAIARALFPALKHRMRAQSHLETRLPGGIFSDAIISHTVFRVLRTGKHFKYFFYTYFNFLITFFWPMFILDFFKRPIFAYWKSEAWDDFNRLEGTIYDRHYHVVSKAYFLDNKHMNDGGYINYDINLVLLAQILAALLFVIAAVVLNFSL